MMALPVSSSAPDLSGNVEETLGFKQSIRLRILDAAVDTLLNDGYAALTQPRVAARAGVRQSHITYYFPTRLALLRETARHGMERMLSPITAAAQQKSVSIDEFITLLLPTAEDRQLCRMMSEMCAASHEDPQLIEWFTTFDGSVLQKIAAGFGSFGIRLDQITLRMLHATFIGAMHLESVRGTEQSLAEARAIIERVLRTVVGESELENSCVATQPAVLALPLTSPQKGAK